MYRDTNAIKELANLKIEEIFDALSIDYKEKYHSLTAPCPIHGGDRKDAFSFHVERGIWRCFSRDCDRRYGSDVFGLISGIRSCSFKEAVEWVSKFVNLDLTPQEVQEIKDSRSNKDFIISVRKRLSSKKKYTWECLKKLVWHDYLVSERKFPEELVREYNIGACLAPNMYMSNRVVIPCINADGEIVGFTGRTLDPLWKSKGIPKWKHSTGNWIDRNVFNAYRAAEAIKSSGVAIICEGPLDVLRLEQAGIKNAVAILGKRLHDGQLTAIMDTGALKLILALDNDAAGKIGTSGALKTAKWLFDIEVVNIPSHRNDIGEMTVEEIRELFGKVVCTVSQ